ncbi:hypothetical protein [Actinacidiphila oryziradicis]|uniref:Uncharacterized protein n=1 Tax=Actinacidiphila oryziradicis TaxID=2571141 RepID=A0A4U0S693_9ACTN|nr:hypothetical protein [Actinacidiphila oryziradicis]TKA04596.1 hypothetical protein FCI23_35655 [Actinacidiphila oryziradicis]
MRATGCKTAWDHPAGPGDEARFAGDRHFIGVVAVPGPRRRRRSAQPEAVGHALSTRNREVGNDALDRAGAVGALTGKDHDQ